MATTMGGLTPAVPYSKARPGCGCLADAAVILSSNLPIMSSFEEEEKSGDGVGRRMNVTSAGDAVDVVKMTMGQLEILCLEP